MKSIVIPDGITEVESCTFTYCSSLESITIPDSVIKIDESAFQECSNLKSIIIPDSVTEVGDVAFSECSSLKEVNIPNKNIQFGRNAFDDDVNMIKDGVSYVFQDLNKHSTNTGSNSATPEKSTSTTNNGTQKPTVQQDGHKAGVRWNWLWSDGYKRNGWYNEGIKKKILII